MNDTKVVLVTGGALGIGAAICTRFALAGMEVIVADRDLAKAQELAFGLGHQKETAPSAHSPSTGQTRRAKAHALQMDVGVPASISAAFEEVRRSWGRCDILVNNAGIAKTHSFIDFPLHDWLSIMAVNLTGVLLCSQEAARLMRERGWGRIITIASVAGMRAVGLGRTAYGTSKAAVIGLTRQMAAELVSWGITANAVAPGPVDTPLTRELHSEAFRAQYTAAIPAGRYGTTLEIAEAVAFLASPEAAYINGVVLPVDGGFMATGARGT